MGDGIRGGRDFLGGVFNRGIISDMRFQQPFQNMFFGNLPPTQGFARGGVVRAGPARGGVTNNNSNQRFGNITIMTKGNFSAKELATEMSKLSSQQALRQGR